MITKENEPIFQRSDGDFLVSHNGGLYGVVNGDENCLYPYGEVKAYLLDHPDALQPEPLPPPPTDAQLESVAESQRQARFAEYDKAIMRLKRAERLGDTTATASITQWDAYAVALQTLNDAPGWFRDTIWPITPEI